MNEKDNETEEQTYKDQMSEKPQMNRIPVLSIRQ